MMGNLHYMTVAFPANLHSNMSKSTHDKAVFFFFFFFFAVFLKMV